MNFGDARLPERFWSKVQPCPMSGCWIWVGAIANGYGQIRLTCDDGITRAVSAHRLVVERSGRRIPTGMHIDHRCEVTCCVNPTHLDIVTGDENTARHWQRHPSTHCPRGHEKSDDNIYVMSGKRVCKTCHRKAMRRWYLKKTANDERAA